MSDVWAGTDRPSGRRLALDLLGTGIFGVLALLATGSLAAGSWLATLCIVVAVVIRRLWLWPAVSLAVTAGVLQLSGISPLIPFADLGYAVICFVLGGHRDQRVRATGLALSVVAVVSGGLWAGIVKPSAVDPSSGFDPFLAVAFAAVSAVVALGGWVAGYLRLQTRTAVQAEVDRQLEDAERRRLAFAYQQEQERSRIAADMHDVVAHAWAVVAAQADGARYLLRRSPDQAEKALEVIGDTARSTIADLRTILQQLKYQEPDGGQPGYAQQEVLFARMRASGMNLEVTSEGDMKDDTLLALTASRLLGESLTNALKHGDLAQPVVVEQDWREGYRLRVSNAIDRDRTDDALGTGHGITGMLERADLAGGRLTARPWGATWVVEATIPDREAHR
ncbi:two-component sensor histidine kinase [Yimella sp. cx-573]|nr:two-component sensor histidine kinase [Yimella sp. cx-573]